MLLSQLVSTISPLLCFCSNLCPSHFKDSKKWALAYYVNQDQTIHKTEVWSDFTGFYIHWIWSQLSPVQRVWYVKMCNTCRCRFRLSGKEASIYKDLREGVCFGDFISFLLKILWKRNNLVSMKNTFKWYLKAEKRRGGWAKPSGSATEYHHRDHTFQGFKWNPRPCNFTPCKQLDKMSSLVLIHAQINLACNLSCSC